MENHDHILKRYLSEQIALEEQLCCIIESQISEIDEGDFADARDLLKKTGQVLERHFTPLNDLLAKLERDAIIVKKSAISSNGGEFNVPRNRERQNRISRILRDDYSALNRITISNTLLHTAALALDCRRSRHWHFNTWRI